MEAANTAPSLPPAWRKPGVQVGGCRHYREKEALCTSSWEKSQENQIIRLKMVTGQPGAISPVSLSRHRPGPRWHLCPRPVFQLQAGEGCEGAQEGGGHWYQPRCLSTENSGAFTPPPEPHCPEFDGGQLRLSQQLQTACWAAF